MDAVAESLGLALGEDYALGALLGRGGMAAVYQATDRRLRREVAIKVLPPELAYSGEYRARFVREAQTAAGLSHPNIVPIFDVGERDGLSWFVMALVEGESLGARVERGGGLPLTAVRRVLMEVGQALAYSHARGVVHRDIKPDNIMLDAGSGRALVTDFGIAAAPLHGSVALTQPGMMLGTARYMSPEQLLGTGPVDARTDQYALALVGSFMLTGKHPIAGETLPAIVAEYMKGCPVDLGALRPLAPEALVEALARSLRSDPAERWPGMEGFTEALREVGGELPEIPPPIRNFFRETERAIVLVSLLAAGIGIAGVGHVPRVFLTLVVGAVGLHWVRALEGARRAGIPWPRVRHALRVERGRRLEEVSQGSGMYPSPLSGVMVVLWLAAVIGASFGDRGAQRELFPIGPLNMILYFAGGLGGFAWWRIFGLHGAQRLAAQRIPLRQWVMSGAAMALTITVVMAIFRIRRGIFTPARLALDLLQATLGMGLAIALNNLVGRWRRAAPKAPEPEWRVPGWLDAIGALLFIRVGRRTG